MKFKFIGDRPDKTTKRYVKSKDEEGNPIVRVIETPDYSPDANNKPYTKFLGFKIPTNGDVVELTRDQFKTPGEYELAMNKLRNNHHYELIDDTSGSKKQSPKAA